MFTWDCAWGSRTATVQARTAIGAKKAAHKTWGKTLRRPEDSEIECFIRRHDDGTPVKPEQSNADLVAQRIMSQPTPPRQHEDW